MKDISILLVLSAALFGQAAQTPPPDAEPAIRISVSLVQVDAVVTDSKGRPVTDLTRDDFEILQDGKPQPITAFTFVNPLSPGRQADMHKPVDKSAPPPVPAANLRPDQVRRTIAIVVDDLGLSAETVDRVRRSLSEFVDRQLEPGDLAAVVLTGSSSGWLGGFTSDKRILHTAIDRLRWNPIGRSGFSATDQVLEGSPKDPDLGHRQRIFTIGTLGSLDYLVRGMRVLPGRKSVVLVSEGIHLFSRGANPDILESMRRLTDQANRSSVVFYTIDPRGVQVIGITAADRVADAGGGNLSKLSSRRGEDALQSQDGLHYLADETGGLFQSNTNEIGDSLRKVMGDQEGYYLIGYNPGEPTFNRLFHKIGVRLKRRGLKVRSRNGFYGVPDNESQPVNRTRRRQMIAALTSPFGADAVRLRLTSIFNDNVKNGSFVSSLIYIDGHDLTFSEEADGWHKATVDVLVVTFGERGMDGDPTDKTYTIRLHGEAYKDALAKGFLYAVAHRVKNPGAYQLRTAVRDEGSGRVGSASEFIEVPDVSKGRLELSGIVLKSETFTDFDPAAGGAREGARELPDPRGSPAVRIFHPGEHLVYAYQILNPHLDVTSGHCDLEIQFRLFKGSREVYKSPPAPLTSATLGSEGHIVTGGNLNMAKTAGGAYVLQVLVTDKLAGKKFQTATQWTDFEVARE